MKKKYFHQEQGKAVGPITLIEIGLRVREGRVRLFDLVYREGDAGWRMALEFEELKAEFKGGTLQAFKERPWVVLQRKGEGRAEFLTSGPFSLVEVQVAIREGRVSYNDYVWRDGFTEWKRIGTLPDFNTRLAAHAPRPADEVPREELLKSVIEIQKPAPPPVELIPPEAKEAEPVAELKSPAPPPPPPPEAALKRVREAPPEDKKRRWSDWGVVAALALVFMASGAYLANYLGYLPKSSEIATGGAESASPGPPQVPVPVEAKPEPAADSAESEIKVQEPSAPPPSAPAGPPKELFLAVQTVSRSQVRIDVRTDATPEYPVYVQLVGLPGQVVEGAAFYRFIKLTPTGNRETPLDLSQLDLPQGIFILRVETGDLKKETRLSVGVGDPDYKKSVNRQRKIWAHAIWKERLQLFALSTALEKELVSAISGKKFNHKPFQSLNQVSRASGGDYLLFENWMEVKDLYQKARTEPSLALIEKTKRARDRIALFSVWK